MQQSHIHIVPNVTPSGAPESDQKQFQI